MSETPEYIHRYALWGALAMPFGLSVFKLADLFARDNPWRTALTLLGSACVLTCMGLLLIGRVETHRFKKRLAAELCLNCGYDLRATPGRCPECGREMNFTSMKTKG